MIGEVDNLEWHRESYNIPAKKGLHVTVDGIRGIITGASGPHIKVHLEGDKYDRPFHPRDITFYKD